MIPVVDLARTDAPHAAHRVGRQIADACRRVGTFQIVGHGISAALIDDVARSGRDFFSLADVDKRRHASPSGNPYLGWAATEAPGASGPVRFHEQLEVSRFDGPADLRTAGYGDAWAPLAEGNRWPTRPADLEPSWRRYFAATEALGIRLLRLMAPGLGVPEAWVARRLSCPASFLACNHYLPTDDGPAVRLEAHTDIGSLTILHQDGGPGGLEVRGPDGAWHGVPSLPGALVVNLGDLFTIWTGGRWAVPEHRVVAPPPGARSARTSIAYFQSPNLDAVVERLPRFAGAGGHRGPHGPVVAGTWIQQRMAEYRQR